MKIKMCYRGVYYDYNPVVFNLNKQQKCFIVHSLDNAHSIQTKFLGKICHKKAISLSGRAMRPERRLNECFAFARARGCGFPAAFMSPAPALRSNFEPIGSVMRRTASFGGCASLRVGCCKEEN